MKLKDNDFLLNLIENQLYRIVSLDSNYPGNFATVVRLSDGHEFGTFSVLLHLQEHWCKVDLTLLERIIYET